MKNLLLIVILLMTLLLVGCNPCQECLRESGWTSRTLVAVTVRDCDGQVRTNARCKKLAT